MIITEEKWNEIITATRAGIDKWKARAAECQCEDRFTVETYKSDNYSVLTTAHDDGWRGKRRAVARDMTTGEVRAATLIMKQRKGFGRVPVGVKIKQTDPKAWKSLADKSADEIKRGLGLTDFRMVTSVVATTTRTTSIFRGYGIEHANGCWIISKNDKEVHRTDSEDDALAWINAERNKQIDQERGTR